MRVPIFTLLVGFIGVTGVSLGAPFFDSLSREEMKEAGLDRLTIDERAKLDELVALHQAGRLEEVREVAKKEAAEEMEARLLEAKQVAAIAAAAELETHLAEVKEEAALEATQEMEARVEEMKEQATAEAVKIVEAKLAAEKRFVAAVDGAFRGWSGRTRFPLDNGQVWMQKRDDMYNVKVDEEAVVVIEKVSYDQYRLIYTKTGAHVPVTRIK